MSAHIYNSDFYDYIDTGSRNSARAFAGLLLPEMEIGSLLDVGAGHGAWAREWREAGVADVVAVDGHYVDTAQLVIPESCFRRHDLSRPLDLGRRFDLVQSLEVAEHIEEQDSETFVDNLAAHGDVILFSAAVPNQGGEHHVNEQEPEYWRRKFAARGYAAYDWLRPQLADRRDVMAWYRFNSVIYANEAGARRLSETIRAARVAGDTALPVGGDFAWTLRRSAVRLVPEGLVKPIAMGKAAIESRIRRVQGATAWS